MGISEMGKLFSAALFGAVFLVGVPTAQASLIGDTINANLSFNDQDDTAVVGAGLEFSFGPSGATLYDEADFDADSVQLIYRNGTGAGPGTFVSKTWTFTDLDWVGMSGVITDIIASVTNPVGATIGAFGDDFFSITLPGYAGLPEDQSVIWEFDIVAEHVPVPATFALYALGLFGLGFQQRRQAKAA